MNDVKGKALFNALAASPDGASRVERVRSKSAHFAERGQARY